MERVEELDKQWHELYKEYLALRKQAIHDVKHCDKITIKTLACLSVDDVLSTCVMGDNLFDQMNKVARRYYENGHITEYSVEDGFTVEYDAYCVGKDEIRRYYNLALSGIRFNLRECIEALDEARAIVQDNFGKELSTENLLPKFDYEQLMIIAGGSITKEEI